MMVHSLFESSEDVSSRLANLEERLMRTTIPEAGNVELQSVFEGLSLTTGAPALNAYQQSTIGAEESSTAASEAESTMNPELDPRVQRILHESRVYSRTVQRHSISTIPRSYRSTGGWSMLSGISLAQISNISVLSIPIIASELWGTGHYLNAPDFQPRGSDRTLVNRKFSVQKLSEIIQRRPAGIGQGFRRLRSPFVLDFGETRTLKEAERNIVLLLGMAIDCRDLI